MMKEFPDDHEIRINYDAFQVTKKVLEKHPIYSELTESHIERWSQTRENVKKKPGRKINSEFEAAIWGKLMICEFGKIKVRNIFYFVIYPLFETIIYTKLIFCSISLVHFFLSFFFLH